MQCCLDAVHEEDQPIVRNAIAAIQVLKKDKILSTWGVSLEGKSYLVTAYVQDGVDCEFSARELEMLHDISPLRIKSASVGRIGGKTVLRVRVSHRDEPLVLTESQVVQVRKRSRWCS